jgi:hypothetical protein
VGGQVQRCSPFNVGLQKTTDINNWGGNITQEADQGQFRSTLSSKSFHVYVPIWFKSVSILL